MRISPKQDAPFWVDEFSSATQARELLHAKFDISKAQIRMEGNNFIPHVLIASSFGLLGESEAHARLPFVFIGALVPIALFLVGFQLHGIRAGLISAIFAIFSYFEITWSLQARGYILQQLIILLTCLELFTLPKKSISYKHIFFLILLITLGLLTHYLLFLFVLTIILFLSFRYITYEKNTTLRNVLLTITGMTALLFTGIFYKEWGNILSSGLFIASNFAYYHSFLWREYTLVTSFGIIGLIAGFLQPKTRDRYLFILLYMTIHMLFISFIFAHHMTKYLLPIFPFLFLGMAVSVDLIAVTLSQYISGNKLLTSAIAFMLCGIFILNGDTFTLKPKPYYSVNTHFREFAVIDYSSLYALIKPRVDKNTAVIETWIDRPRWYLGNTHPGIFLFRWEDESGNVNGHAKRTSVKNQDGLKVISDNTKIGFIGNMDDFKKVQKKYPKGFLFIDDSSLPQDVRDYASKNLKKEMYLEHYSLDPNPYSIWPATLYSWGF